MPVCNVNHINRQRELRRAFPIYSMWFTGSKRSTPTFETFQDSKFGTYFIKFIEWCDMMRVVSPMVYAKVMLHHKIHPMTWATTDCYALYIKEFDAAVTVDEWLLITVATIERVCNTKGVEPRHFYNHTPPNELIHLIRTRALYPRYLICDPKFAAYVASWPVPVSRMISEAVDDQYVVPAMPCDATVMAVIQHVNVDVSEKSVQV